MLNLYMTFDLYYSWYGDQNATTKDNLFIEISKDGGILGFPRLQLLQILILEYLKIMDLLGVIPIL